MLKIGISTCGKTPDDALFHSFAAASVEAAELSPEQDAYDDLDYQAARRAAEGAGVALWSFHLQFMPFEALDPSAPEPAKRRRTVERLAAQIERAADIGVTRHILHASAEPIPAAERPAHMAFAKESVFALAETAARCGGVLCVEDLPRTCLGRDSAEIAELVSVSPAARVCFDTNHLLTESPAAFIAALGGRIETLHVSDYDFIDEKHWLPGEGSVDWGALYAALLAADYGGVWMYELGFGPKDSMPRSRNLTPADFVRNAREIFRGAPLTRIL